MGETCKLGSFGNVLLLFQSSLIQILRALCLWLSPYVQFIVGAFTSFKPLLIFQVWVAVAGCFSPGVAAGKHGICQDAQCPAVCTWLHGNPNSLFLLLFTILDAIISISYIAAVIVSSSNLSLGGAVRRTVPDFWDPGSPGLYLGKYWFATFRLIVDANMDKLDEICHKSCAEHIWAIGGCFYLVFFCIIS